MRLSSTCPLTNAIDRARPAALLYRGDTPSDGEPGHTSQLKLASDEHDEGAPRGKAEYIVKPGVIQTSGLRRDAPLFQINKS